MSGDIILHAGAVALCGRAVLILGPAGAGKSTLALDLMARGARLVSDDRTIVEAEAGRLVACAPEPIRGLIEARGIGLLRAVDAGPTPLCLAVDLGRSEEARLPEQRHITLCEIPLPLLFRPPGSHLAAAILQWLKDGGPEWAR